eukprot:13818873-Heterocapsa_arctica.AAC.1
MALARSEPRGASRLTLNPERGRTVPSAAVFRKICKTHSTCYQHCIAMIISSSSSGSSSSSTSIYDTDSTKG